MHILERSGFFFNIYKLYKFLYTLFFSILFTKPSLLHLSQLSPLPSKQGRSGLTFLAFLK